MENVSKVLEELPEANKALFKSLLELLEYVKSNAEVNKMTSANLSIVFAPNLIRSPKDSVQMAVMHAPIINSLMCLIIDNLPYFLPALQSASVNQ